MGHFALATVTNKGREMLNESMAGRYVTITKAEACEGSVETIEALKELTALSSESKQTLSIVGDRVTDEGRTITLQAVNADEEYKLTQIGVFAQFDDTQEEILLYVLQEDPNDEKLTPVTVPGTEDPPFYLDVYTHLNIGNELDKFEVSIDAAGAVNVELLTETLEEHNTNRNAHLIPDDNAPENLFRLGVENGKLYMEAVENG